MKQEVRNLILKNGSVIEYTLSIKKVKNINLRIKNDGMVYVSANKNVPISLIENFISSKADFIENSIKKFKNSMDNTREPVYTEKEVKELILSLCTEIYPYFKNFGIEFPQIKFRKMVSRWGSCHYLKGVLVFNTNLRYASKEVTRYVVVHEFTHFLQPNHSKAFYFELEKLCPEWKLYKRALAEVNIRNKKLP